MRAGQRAVLKVSSAGRLKGRPWAVAAEEPSYEYGSTKYLQGRWAFYKGVALRWMQQIPYTMMKFAFFERTVEALSKYVVPKPQSQCTKAEQLAVTFAAGYIAGVFCAVVSHPADSVVSVLNKEKGSTAFEVPRNLAFGAVWKALFARIIMIGTLTALQWFICDSVKVCFKLSRPPVPQTPKSLKKRSRHGLDNSCGHRCPVFRFGAELHSNNTSV
nr:solute carrier family 25 member 3-like [Kogia breviceps]